MRKELYDRDKGLCRACGISIPFRYAEGGHRFPKNHTQRTAQMDDMFTLCFDCNFRMGQRIPEEAGMVIYSLDDIHNAPRYGQTYQIAPMDEIKAAGRDYSSFTKNFVRLSNSMRGLDKSGRSGREEAWQEIVHSVENYKNRLARDCSKAVKDDPLAYLAEGIEGFGLLNFCNILACAGRPSRFKSPNSYIKYFLAPITDDGSKVDKNAPYSRKGAGICYTIGFSANMNPDTLLGQLLRASKEYELSKLPEEKGRNGHAQNRAFRCVAKTILKALWCADTGSGFSLPTWDGCPDLTWLKRLVEKSGSG